ncbi:MAG: glycosyltransferase family 4 protein [Candidatus Aminicenantes bacterium]|nr:glycosyltransferase family 4 protein [Candidatus Aminicenantes bacterium]
MNILILNHNVVGRGTYLRCYDLGRYLARQGHGVTLLTTSLSARLRAVTRREGGVHIVEFPDLFSRRWRTGICPWNTLRRMMYVAGKKFDIIHAFDTRPVVIFPALLYKFKAKVPLVIDWADWWGRGGTIWERSGPFYRATLGRVETFFEEYFRRFADRSTVISTALERRLVDLGGEKSKILVLFQGTEGPPGPPLDKARCRQVLRLKAEGPIVGHLGALFEKDARLLFDSLAKVRDRRPDVQLILIGRHRLRLHNFPGIKDFTLETGEIAPDEVWQYLGACDLLLLPMTKSIANDGRWPSKFNLYLAAGRPVVSTRISDIKSILEKEKIGLLADDNPDDFSRAILGLLADGARQTELGKKGQAYGQSVLSWPTLVNRLLVLYEQALADRRAKD